MNALPDVASVIPTRIQTAHSFYANGTTTDVLTKWAEALALESHEDVKVEVQNIQLGTQTCAVGFRGNEKHRLGVTRFAWLQLFQRAASKSCPAASSADYAWWAEPAFASSAWVHVRDRGHKTKTLVARIASDVHGKGLGQKYVRGFISERHSGDQADDLALLRNLYEPLTDRSDSRFGGRFVDGRANVIRDPGNETVAWFTSSARLEERTNAKLSLRITNSEVGRASLSHTLFLTFETGKAIRGNAENGIAHVEVPIADARGSSRHIGDAAGRAVRHLADNLMRTIGWASELEKLTTTKCDAAVATRPDEYFLPLLERHPPRPEMTDDDRRALLVEAIEAAYAVTKKSDSKLFEVVVLAFLKLSTHATAVIRDVCGSIR